MSEPAARHIVVPPEESQSSLRPLLTPGAPPDETFDRISRLAMLVLDAKAAMVSLVDGDSVQVVSVQGIDCDRRLVLSDTICQHTAAAAGALLIPDGRVHPLACESVAVRKLGFVGYAGVPLSGAAHGSLCVLDNRPRTWNETDARVLEELAAIVSSELELRRRADFERAQKDTILDSIGVAFVSLDRAGTLLAANQEVGRFLHTPPHALIGLNAHDVVPDPSSELAAMIERVLSATVPIEFEYFSSLLECWFAVEAFPSAEGVHVFVRDVTRRKQAQAKLREAETQYQALVENLPLVAYTGAAGADVLVKYMNQHVEELLGYPVEEWLTKPDLYHSVVHPDDLERVKREFANTHERREHCSSEYRMIARDGRVVWVLDETVPVLDEDGNALCFQGFWLDITQRKEMELALVELASVIESSDDAILGTSLDGTARSWNAGAERIYGYAADEMIGRSILSLAPEPLRAELAELIERVAAGEPIRHYETTHLTKTGQEIVVWLTVSPIRSQSGELVGASTVARDITEQRLLEEHVREAQHVEALGRLAGGIAHDFNNLLTAITGYGTFLVGGFDPGDPRRADAEEICKAAGRAAVLTRQLLAYSRRQVLAPEVLSVNAVVSDLHTMLPRLLGEDLEIVAEPVATNPWVKADRGQIEQVILNLAVNARDAMAAGGRLRIETQNLELDLTAAQAAGVSPGPYVALVATDTGHGMDDETRKHVFEPFFTTKEVGKGTGLGLSSVYGIVKQSDGFVEVHSESGVGSVFTVCLPSVGAPGEAAPAAEAPVGVGGGRETVLLVEDEDAVRRLARLTLERAGYKVLEAGNGSDALALAEAYDGRIDVLLTDVVMPVMGGPELAAQFSGTETRIVFMSGYPADAAGRGIPLDAAGAFVQKPFTPHVLAGAVRSVLDA